MVHLHVLAGMLLIVSYLNLAVCSQTSIFVAQAGFALVRSNLVWSNPYISCRIPHVYRSCQSGLFSRSGGTQVTVIQVEFGHSRDSRIQSGDSHGFDYDLLSLIYLD